MYMLTQMLRLRRCQNGETWKMKTSRSIWWIWQEHKEIIQWMRIGCLPSCLKRDENCKRIRNVHVDTDAEIEEVPEWGDLEDEDFQEHLVDMARAQGDNPMDEDWLPPRLLKRDKNCKRIRNINVVS